MQFVTDTLINKFTDQIIEAPALAKLPDFNKDGFKNILKQYFEEIYKNRPQYIENFFNYKPDDAYIDVVLDQYNIDKKYYNNLNPAFKKILVYFIEKAYQNKGSIGSLNIFSEIFETIFSAVNFYKIIVIKKEIVVDGVRQYYLTYSLDPLYINNHDAILTKFEDKVSLTGKHLMSLDQYSDFNVFPVNTNLIYIQFTSAQSNIDNDKTFNFLVRAYAITKLNLNNYKINDFNNLYFNLVGSDIEIIIRYADMLRLRKTSPDFDFKYSPFSATINLKMAKEHIATLEDFMYEYKNLKYNDRKQVSDFRRRWVYFLRNYLTSSKDYLDFESMEKYMESRYPDLTKYLQNLEKDEFMQFFIDFYNFTISSVGFDDDYLIMYLNFIFLGVITGEAFLDNFFIPLYRIFQKYIFPIEMDFLNKITETFIIKDKFESFGTTETFHTWMTVNGFMSKHWLRTDHIFTKCKVRETNILKISDKNIIWVISNNNDDLKLPDNNHILIKSKIENKLIINNRIMVFIISKNKDIFSKNDNNHILIKSGNDDNLKNNLKNDLNSILINKTEQTKQKSQDSINVSPIVNNDDNNLTLDNNNIKLLRYDYTQKINDLETYLIFYKEQYRILSSYEQNSLYKITNTTDNIYFNYYKIF